MHSSPHQQNLISTGIPGLDTVLGGGLTPHRIYLLEGEPGAGKTTVGLQFLNEGVRCGESVMYITLAETAQELTDVAASHGWNLAGIRVHEVLSEFDLLAADSQYSMFHPSEVEAASTLQRILREVKTHEPVRLVLDSLSELQMMAESPLRYRRQVMALKQFFSAHHCTVLLLDNHTESSNGDAHVRSIAHGVIQLDHSVKDYGAERRRLRVVKFRGRKIMSFARDQCDYR